LSDKLSVLFKPCRAKQIRSHFLKKNPQNININDKMQSQRNHMKILGIPGSD